MRNTVLSLLAAATLCAGGIQAAEPSAPAQARATLYQREVRTALTKHGWRITEDRAGQLDAERRLIQNGTVGIISNDTTFAHLAVRFHADSRNHTAATATAARYIRQYPDSPEVDRLVYPPLALRDPRLTEEYRAILAEADGHLAKSHPAYAAAKTGTSEADAPSGQLAMK